MKRSLLDVLVDPARKADLELTVEETDGEGNVISGGLRNDQGVTFLIQNGIPRFVPVAPSEAQTKESFGFKWQQRDAYEHPRVNELNLQNELKRFGFKTPEEFITLFRRDGWVLDMGCGSGHYASLYVAPSGNGHWVGTDFSSGIDVAKDRLGGIQGTHFVQADIFQLPYRERCFDLIVCRGMMHHTASTEQAFQCLVPLIKPGGEFIFLVYKKNGRIREFTDDYIREVISSMPPEKAWEALKPLTKLGKALNELNVKLNVPEDIPCLGIQAGSCDLHLFIYNHFLKAFWNKDWTLEESNLISFDWYHPKYAFRHTEEEIRGWCEKAGLEVKHLNAHWTSYAVRAIKN